MSDPVRRQRIRAASKAWTNQLVDLGGRNTLLHYRDLKQGTLDLETAEPVAVDSLLVGHTVRLSNLYPGPALPPVARRARTIRAKATENFEERGLQTLFLGWGMATWTNTRGATRPAAPILLRLADLTPRGRAGEEFDLSLTGDWELNPTLVHLLGAEHQVVLPEEALLDLLDDDTGAGPDPVPLFEQITKAAGEALRDFSVDGRIVLGNFSYAKLPMVKDIAAAEDVLVGSDILSAIAGDETARAALRARRPTVDLGAPDLMPPTDEFVVLDADASQSYVINAAVAGGDLVVEGPPGTGKSQTIANLIATLAARGERVLFVAEKRAAIDAVLDRLDRAGLGDLVMDLHDATRSKRRLAADLSKALADASATPLPNLTAVHDRLTARRDVLRARVQALHEPRAPWGVSVYDLQARLTAIPPEARTAWRLRGEPLKALDAADFAGTREDLRAYLGLGGPAAAESSPWAAAAGAGTITSGQQAEAALATASNLLESTFPASRAVLDRAVAECGLTEPARIDDWTYVLALLADVARLLGRFEPGIHELPHAELAAALAPAAKGGFSRFLHQIVDRRYRAAKRRLQALAEGEPTTAELRQAVIDAGTQLASWRTVAADPGSTPRLPADLQATAAAFGRLEAEVQAVAGWAHRSDLGSMGPSQLAATLAALVADRSTLAKVPELFRLRSNLLARGLGPLLADVQARDLPVETARACLDHAWLASVLETVELTDPTIGAFDGDAHRSTVAEFQEADVAHVETSARRVKRAVAERITAVRDAYPAESDVIERQARLKQRHMPLRRLFQEAPHVLGALKPCWAMSPLVVAQLLPPETCFDVVVFDEASQVTPADAVGALMRADRAVVAGDPHQLPPTSFFAMSGGGEDEEEEAVEGPEALTTDMESVLDVMATLLPRPLGTRTLGWHYRSKDERLIAFSNAQANLYDWSLTTFPGVFGHESLRHELVPFVAGRVGQEDSVADEVQRVVELVREHARLRPDESLGVIAMGLKHAHRITEALRLARLDDDTLNAFCDETAAEPLFVKNLERVQGDERDAILLSIGYGKHDDGRMRYQFGPLNQAGGERRLNVAITRARRRMTVVSSFSSADMDPDKLRAEGARMLGGYLRYVESQGANLGTVSKPKPALDAFEVDVRDGLVAAGIPLVAQHGCSADWIDFAAQHRTRPAEMVLAIECDGAGYRAGATSRDRDRLRQAHLERLGWRFHRIWSSDWCNHRDREIARAVAAYEEAIAAADALHAAEADADALLADGSPATAASMAPAPDVEAAPAAEARADAEAEFAGDAGADADADADADGGFEGVADALAGFEGDAGTVVGARAEGEAGFEDVAGLEPGSAETPGHHVVGDATASTAPTSASGRDGEASATPGIGTVAGTGAVGPEPDRPGSAPRASADDAAPAPAPRPGEPSGLSLDAIGPSHEPPARGPRPEVGAKRPITGYRRDELVAIVRWIESDTLLRTEEELTAEVMRELGFGRKGSRITATITAAIREARTGPT